MVPTGNFHELGKLGKDISAAALAQLTNQLGILINLCVVAIQLSAAVLFSHTKQNV